MLDTTTDDVTTRASSQERALPPGAPPCCTLCSGPLRPGHLLVAQAAKAAVILCTLCKGLERVRAGLSLEETRTRRANPGTAEQLLSQESATQLLVAWAERHDHILPETRYFGKGEALPSINAVRRLWGSLVKARRALQRAYPHLRLPDQAPWDQQRICRVMEAWITRQGRLPLNADLKREPSLPCPSVMYTHYTGLKAFYQEFRHGQYYEDYCQQERQARREAGRQGRMVRNAACS